MNQEQFGQFWGELRTPLKAIWKVTTEDVEEIQGDLVKFDSVLQRRYGELQKEEMTESGTGTPFPSFEFWYSRLVSDFDIRYSDFPPLQRRAASGPRSSSIMMLL